MSTAGLQASILSYKQHPEKIQQPYDAVVIGSGLGGLSAAAILAKEGKRILVLERHYTAGGFTHSFTRRGYEWDVGIHYLGEVHRPHTELANWFSYISDDQLQWADMGEVYDKIIFGTQVFEFHKGKENFITHLQQYFPSAADQQSIEDYVALLYEITRTARLYFAEKALPNSVSWAVGGLLRRKFLQWAQKTTLEVLSGITKNQQLIGVLTGQYGDYGLTPSKSSFAIHAMVAKHFLNGGSFPIGGCSRIANTISDVIAKAGGCVLTNAEVDQILLHKGAAVGVRLADGAEIRSNLVISDAGILNTFGRLLPPDVAQEYGLNKQMQQVQPSVGHVGLYLGFKKTAQELGLGKANYWIYPPDGYDHDANLNNYLQKPDEAPFPVTYISFPSAKDPDWLNRYPGTATIDIISVAPYEWFSQWENTRWKKRGDEYNARKEQITQRLLQVLYQYEPHLEQHLDYHELSTPLSTRNFSNYAHGELYGIDHNPQRFGLRFLRPQTPLKNLYLSGQDIASAGIGGALTGGVLAVSAILKRDMAGKMRREVQAMRQTNANRF